MRTLDCTIGLGPAYQLSVPEELSVGPVKEEMLAWSLDEQRRKICFVARITGEQSSIEAAIAELDPLIRYEILATSTDQFEVYAEMELSDTDRRLFRSFDRAQVVLVGPLTYVDTATVKFTVVGTTDGLEAMIGAFPSAISISVDRIGSGVEKRWTPGSDLTHRQLEALRLALDCGYYDNPRSASLSTVADALDCTTATASTHLRKAERTVIEAAIGSSRRR